MGAQRYPQTADCLVVCSIGSLLLFSLLFVNAQRQNSRTKGKDLCDDSYKLQASEYSGRQYYTSSTDFRFCEIGRAP